MLHQYIGPVCLIQWILQTFMDLVNFWYNKYHFNVLYLRDSSSMVRLLTLYTPTKSSFTRSRSGDGSFLKSTLQPRNFAAFSVSVFNYRVTMKRIDKWHAEKRGKNHQFVKIKEIIWKQYRCGSMRSHDLCYFQLENHTSNVISRGKLRENFQSKK